MTKGTTFYLLAFITIVGATMVHRYLWQLPSFLLVGCIITGLVFAMLGNKANGKKTDWNFDFSPSGKQRKNRR